MSRVIQLGVVKGRQTMTMKRVAFYGMMAFLGGGCAQVALYLLAISPAQATQERQLVANRMYVMTPEGQMRIQAGTYEQAGEKGLPVLALSDNKDKIRLLFRLAGTNESPVLVMKDRSGADRLVMGLKLSGSSEEPFLQVVNDQGARTDLMAKGR